MFAMQWRQQRSRRSVEDTKTVGQEREADIRRFPFLSMSYNLVFFAYNGRSQIRNFRYYKLIYNQNILKTHIYFHFISYFNRQPERPWQMFSQGDPKKNILSKKNKFRVGVANFSFGSIDRYWRDQYISVKILSSIKIVGATCLGGLWALEWAWHIRVTNLRCVQGYGI